MRSWIVPVIFCFFLFIVPLQCFIIGHDMGAGIQGAVYRYQITSAGESVIPVTAEFSYVTSGGITGKTAMSIIVWTLGTVILSLVAITSLILWDRIQEKQLILLIKCASVAGVLYGIALIIQYGILLSGPAGISLPIGIILLFIFLICVYFYRLWLLKENDPVFNI